MVKKNAHPSFTFEQEVTCPESAGMRLTPDHPTHQAFDHLQQFLHHHSDALVAQQSAHDLNVGGSQEVSVGAEYAAVRHV